MRNFKKILSLVLCMAMMLSVMVVGAGAAFKDQEKIVNTEAVDVCSALNIINGYTDGSYKPEGNITRAEACKMICVALNGGKEPVLGTNATPTFSDVRGTSAKWAEGYIEYCVSEGIVAGIGGGKFNPNGNVTGSQFAKMLLIALGYRADHEKFLGNAWEVNVNVKATQKDLYHELEGMDVSAALTRDNAAQMVWNALQAKEVVYDYTLVSENGQLVSKVTVKDGAKTLLEDKYNAKIFEGTFDGNYKTGITATKDYIQITGDLTTADRSGNWVAKEAVFPYDLDAANIGETVRVIFKDGTNGATDKPDKNDTIYGVYNTGTTEVVNATVADIADDFTDAGKVKIDGAKYEIANGAKIITNMNGAGITADKTSIEALVKTDPGVTGDQIRVLINSDGKISNIYLTTSDLYKVTAVSGSKVSVAGIGTIDTSENGTTVYSGVAKDDVVVVTKLYKDRVADATFVIEKADTVSGKVTGFNGTKSITIDGTVYKVYAEAAMKTGLTDDSKANLISDDIDKDYTLYLVNGYVRAAQKTTDELNQYAIVLDQNSGILDSTFNEPKAELLLADGTKKTVVLHKDSVIKDSNNDASTSASDLTDNQLVKYVEKDNGQFKVEETGIYATANNSVKIYVKDTKSFNNIVTAGDAVLFYTDANGKMKVTSLRSLNDVTVANSKNYAYVTNSDGKVVAAYADLTATPSGASDTTLYGIVTDELGTVKVGDDTYQKFTVWTGTDTTVLVEGNKTNELSKGTLVKFDEASNGKYMQDDTKGRDFTVLDGSATAKGVEIAVTEYNEADKTITYATALKLEGNAYVADSKTTKAIDSDVKIVYVDRDGKKAGDAGMGITSFDGTTGYANALLVFENDNPANKVVGIIVNTNTDTDVTGDKVAASAYQIDDATATQAGVTVKAVPNKGYAVKGETITYTVTVSGTATTGAAGDTVTLALPNLTGASSLAPAAGTNCSAAGLVITITSDSLATSGTFTVSGVVAGNVTATLTGASH